jgi:hypothetical protein
MTAAQDTVNATAAWLDGLASGAAAQSNWLASVAGGAAQTAAALRAIDWGLGPAPTLSLAGPGGVKPSKTVATPVAVTVALSNLGATDVSGSWAVTGQQPGDLAADGGTFLVPAGQPSAVIPLVVNPLTLAAARKLTVTLSGVVGAAEPLPGPLTINLVKNTGTGGGTGTVLDVASDQDFKRAESLAKPGDTVRMAARAYAENAFGAAGVLYLAGEPGVSVAVPGLVTGAGDTVRMAARAYAENAFGAAGVLYLAGEPGVSVAVPGLVTGAGATVQGIAFPRSLRLAGPGCGSRACVIGAKDDGTAVALTLDGDGCWSDYDEITDFAHRGVLVSGTGVVVDHFHLHHQRDIGANITQTTAGFMFGGTHPKDARSLKGVARRGLITDIGLHDYLEVKAHDCRAEYVSVVGGDTPGDAYVRHGSNFVFYACWVRDGRILLGDDNALAVACVTEGKHGATLGFRKGNGTGPDATAGRATYPFARNCRAVAHQGAVDTAWANGTGPQWKDMPQGTVLEGIAKSQVSGGGPAQFVPLATRLPDPARLLTPADVGPAAFPG